MRHVPNTYRVPVRQWRKWAESARTMFNFIYRTLQADQRIITHPKMGVVAPAHWKTISWNAAWLAADEVGK